MELLVRWVDEVLSVAEARMAQRSAADTEQEHPELEMLLASQNAWPVRSHLHVYIHICIYSIYICIYVDIV